MLLMLMLTKDMLQLKLIRPQLMSLALIYAQVVIHHNLRTRMTLGIITKIVLDIRRLWEIVYRGKTSLLSSELTITWKWHRCLADLTEGRLMHHTRLAIAILPNKSNAIKEHECVCVYVCVAAYSIV